MEYDLVIIGAGPSGLALAQASSSIGKKILIIDRENQIGGSHRVRRVKQGNELLFTEHGPRIYTTAYKNFINLLKEMNSDFFNLFTPYNFTISAISGETVFNALTKRELFKLFINFIYLIFNDDYGNNTTMKTFLEENNFSKKSTELINRICRLTDGAGIEKYTLNEFLQLVNQQSLYKIYQPKLPNDIGLFKIWKSYLEKKNVEFLLSSEVEELLLNDDKTSIKNIKIKNNSQLSISAKKFVMAVPPINMVKIIEKSNDDVKNAFGDFNMLKKWSIDNAYIDYISITLHWDSVLVLPKVYGFPKTDWGVCFIILSDYMKFEETNSKTVISTAITFIDRVSKNNNKTANECSESELMGELYNQLLESFPSIPKPNFSILSPGVKFDTVNKKWFSEDTAFISSSNAHKLSYESETVKNLYNVGTHNGRQNYKFTTLESAVSNSLELSKILYPELKEKYKTVELLSISKIIIKIIFIILTILIIYLIYRINKNTTTNGR